MTQNNANDNTDSTNPGFTISRRSLIKQAGCMSAAVLSVASGSASSSASAAQVQTAVAERIPVREAFETLTAQESEVLDALVSRILPSDENGPGAHEARVVHFIDRNLAGPLSSLRSVYAAAIEAVERHALSEKSQSFIALDADEQDLILSAIEAGEVEGFFGSSADFFTLLRTHTIEGAFSDPYYGGNRDFIGWDMLGYPGVRIGSSPDDVSQGSGLQPSRQSAYDMPPYTKNPVDRSSATSNGSAGHGD